MSHYPLRGRHGDTVRTIGRRVVDGQYELGQILDPDLLGAELGVSRTVLREAFKVLAAKGLIDARPTRGTYVLSRGAWNLLDPDVLEWHTLAGYDGRFVDELVELRLLTEPQVAELAARRCTGVELAELADAVAGMRRAARGLDSDAFLAADLRFHRVLLGSSRNELLRRFEPVVEATLRASVREPEPARWKVMAQSHGALLLHLRSGDGVDAAAQMRLLVEAEGRDAVRHAHRHARPA
jgi:GntR family transcriptional regulator, galactonate operon transcriptional repressor